MNILRNCDKRRKMYTYWDKKEAKLQKDIEAQRIELPRVKTHAVSLPNEDLDNWDDEI